MLIYITQNVICQINLYKYETIIGIPYEMPIIVICELTGSLSLCNIQKKLDVLSLANLMSRCFF